MINDLKAQLAYIKAARAYIQEETWGADSQSDKIVKYGMHMSFWALTIFVWKRYGWKVAMITQLAATINSAYVLKKMYPCTQEAAKEFQNSYEFLMRVEDAFPEVLDPAKCSHASAVPSNLLQEDLKFCSACQSVVADDGEIISTHITLDTLPS